MDALRADNGISTPGRIKGRNGVDLQHSRFYVWNITKLVNSVR